MFGSKWRDETYRLKDEIRHRDWQILKLTEEKAQARAVSSKLRARNRTLREEQHRLRELLKQHNIPWEREPQESQSERTDQ